MHYLEWEYYFTSNVTETCFQKFNSQEDDIGLNNSLVPNDNPLPVRMKISFNVVYASLGLDVLIAVSLLISALW